MQTKRWRITRSRSPKRCRRGAAIIETAIGFTVLIMLMFGVLEAALFYQDHEMLTNITREAARRMAVGSTASAAKTKALQWNMGNSKFTDVSVHMTIEENPDASLTTGWTSVAPAYQATTNNWVRVRTTYTHTNLTRFFGASSDLNATSVMRVENGR